MTIEVQTEPLIWRPCEGPMPAGEDVQCDHDTGRIIEVQSRNEHFRMRWFMRATPGGKGWIMSAGTSWPKTYYDWSEVPYFPLKWAWSPGTKMFLSQEELKKWDAVQQAYAKRKLVLDSFRGVARGVTVRNESITIDDLREQIEQLKKGQSDD